MNLSGSQNHQNAWIEGLEIRNFLAKGVYLSGTQGVGTGVILNDLWVHHIFGQPGAQQFGMHLNFGDARVTNCEISHIGHGGEAMGIWMWRNHNAVIDSNLLYFCRKSCVREATGLLNQITNNYMLLSWAGGECSVGVAALWANNIFGFNHINLMKHSNQNGLAVWGLAEAPAKYRFWHNDDVPAA